MRGLSTIPRQATRGRCSAPGRRRGAMARHVAVDLSSQAVDQVAARVVQLLRESEAQGVPDLLSAGELARRLRVERPWVYRYRHQLGGIRIGAGPKAPWRFEYAAAVEALRELQATQRNGGGL
jgi:hypothetical protein